MPQQSSNLKDALHRFAPVVFWAGIIVLVLGVVVLASGLTAGSGRGPVPTEYMIYGGVVLLILSALMRPDAVRQILGIRGVRYGGNALVMTIGVIAILGILNYFASSTRFDWRQDLTSNKQFTLSDQTLTILQNLKAPVKATAFFTQNAAGGKQDAEDRLKEYALRSNGKLTYEFVDPDERPDLAQSMNLAHDGAVIFQQGTKMQEADVTGESDLTLALIKLTSDKARAAYFITGHKERDPNDSADDGYATASTAIQRENYSVDTLNLQITSTIPASATVLILANPTTALTDAEVKALDTYLSNGGRLMVMTDPKATEPVNALLAKWGVQFDIDEVVDPASYIQNTSPLLPLVNRYPASPITSKINGLPAVFPFAHSIQQTNPAPTGLTIQSLVQTTAQSWGETTLDPNIPVQYDAGKDIKGPLNIGFSIEGTLPVSPTATTTATDTKKTRIVVFGTSQFVTNAWLQRLQGAVNSDLFVNSLNWLAEDEALISIRPVDTTTPQLVMTGSQLSTVFLIAVVLLPGLVFIAGFSVWWRRR